MTGLQVVQTQDLLTDPKIYIGESLQIEGILTTADPTKHLWILDNQILVKPCQSDLIMTAEKGQFGGIRGVFVKSARKYPRYELRHAYYNPYNVR